MGERFSIRNASGGVVFGKEAPAPTLDLSKLRDLEGEELQKDLQRRNGGVISSREQDRPMIEQMKQGILAGVINEDQATKLMRLNPGAQMELAIALKQAKQPADPSSLFGKIDPKNFTTESVKQFQTSRDYSVLVPREDPNASNARSDRLFTQTAKLRDEFRNLSKDYIQVRDSYGRIQESAKNPSAAGDLALIFNYMKMLDPGSTVREGEFATAQNSAGIPDRIRAAYNKVIEGERLADNTRNDFTSRAGALYKRQLATHKKNTAQYSALAKRYGVDPQNVTTDFTMDEMPEPPAQGAKQAPDGKWYVPDPNRPGKYLRVDR